MVSPAETGANFQPQAIESKSNRFKKLGLKVGVGVLGTATLFAARGALPAEAGGNMKLVTASSEGTSCLEGESVLVTDFAYAAQLLEQIASGEIVIAIGPAPVAALKEGDKTAVTKPITITPDEIWANLAKPAPDCPPVVEPTPTPEIPKTATDLKTEAREAIKDKEITPGQLKQDVIAVYKAVPDLMSDTPLESELKNVDNCVTGGDPKEKNPKLIRRNRISICGSTALYYFKTIYPLSKYDNTVYTLSRDYVIYGEQQLGKPFDQALNKSLPTTS